jgi:hypothetical protein
MRAKESNVMSFLAWATTGLLLVFALYTAGVLYATRPITEFSVAKAASFADSYGALTSLFAGLGFIVLLATIFLQREELKLNRQELEETRKEIAAQNKTLKRQRFEGVFYRMIELYKINLKELSIRRFGKEAERLEGINALSYLIDRFNNEWNEKELPDFPAEAKMQVAFTHALVRCARSVFVRQARYVETLNSILELIEKETESDEQVHIYRQILASQLTAYEITYLFYQSLITPDFSLLREMLSRSQAFRSRVEMLRVPDSHRKAWELLYHLQLPHRRAQYKTPMDQDQIKGAKREMRQIRRHIRDAKKRRRVQEITLEPQLDADIQA